MRSRCDGINRPVQDDPHCWPCRSGDWLAYHFTETRELQEATGLLDSALDSNVALSQHQRDGQLTAPPAVMPRAFRLEGLRQGQWQMLHTVTDNHQRLVRLPISGQFEAVRFTLDATWGNEASRVYAFYLE